ncbi:MAG: cytidine deaminase [Treponemataceae bacterium]
MKISRTQEKLFLAAMDASKNAYAPYSKFRVGSAVLTESEKIITGCNIENRSFGLSNCAERTALFKAISENEKPVAIAVATPDADYPVAPCGACRQVISEFMSQDAQVIFGNQIENLVLSTVQEIYPFDSLHELGK